MAQIMYLGCRKVFLLSVLLFIFVSVCFSACHEPQLESSSSRGSSRKVLEAVEEEQEKPLKKKTISTNTSQSTKNPTKLINPSSKNQTKTIKSNNDSNKNQTKPIKFSNISTKNQTKPIKSSNISIKNQTKTIKSGSLQSNKNQTKQAKVSSTSSSSKTSITDTGLLKKLNSATSSTIKIKKLNSTDSSKPSSTSSKKPLDLSKSGNKTAKATASNTKDKSKDKENKQTKTTIKVDNQSKKPPTKQTLKDWFIEEDEDDLVSEFTDLPNKFHKTLIPDLERFSTTSKAYITKANNEITKGFKPYVGKKYAPTIATIISCAFILIPLLLVSLLCNRIKAYFSLQKIIIFIQVYLSIYFIILCISSLVTGLEPLKFLFTTSHSTYLCLQVLQSLAYVFYLLLLLMYLVLVFSTECGLGSKFVGLVQSFVGFAVGLHYYVTVFHRVVLQQPPKTSWKIHGIYATCFLIISLLARADRRKKVYVEEGGGEGKIN
ncbi:hypothetical protein TanjilG_05760 [Lupinus angustifolius]|uniref:Uncharacterized protein n=1 Tax=Lupinus angustifolius TaxID=3871 RepID=A0A4P1R3E8_LUPAN|nr:PREDICTED: uncharacterized protein LOC109362811 [Lupinus angustifolius]OIW00410.1 hypothetical protein TanjilG_05760 [Lupinus angustifolius]